MEKGEIIYGINPVFEAIRTNRERVDKIMIDRSLKNQRLFELLKFCRKNKAVVSLVPTGKIKQWTGNVRHQGVIAFTAAKEFVPVEQIVRNAAEQGTKALVLVLDGVEDPHNMGAVIRSAAAAGAAGLILTPGGCCRLSATVAKTSAGAIEHIPIARPHDTARTLDIFRKAGMNIYGLASNDAENFYSEDFSQKGSVICLGSEKSGIRPHIKRMCDRLLQIPIKGEVESLNVSVAAGIAVFEVLRQRKTA